MTHTVDIYDMLQNGLSLHLNHLEKLPILPIEVGRSTL